MRSLRLAVYSSIVTTLAILAFPAFADTNRQAICNVSRYCTVLGSGGTACGAGATCNTSPEILTNCAESLVGAANAILTSGDGRCLTPEQQSCLGNPTCLSAEAGSNATVASTPVVTCNCTNGTQQMCVTLTGISQCGNFRNSPTYATVAARNPNPVASFNCTGDNLTDAQRRSTSAGGVCSRGPGDLATLLQDAPAANTAAAPAGGLTTQANRRPPVVPSLGVPIPGLTLSAPEFDGGQTHSNFIAQYVAAVYRFGLSTVLIITTIMVVYGGFRYLLGSGMGDIKEGKEIIQDAIIGMLIVLGGYVILQTVNPATLDLSEIGLTSINSDIIRAADDDPTLTPTGNSVNNPTNAVPEGSRTLVNGRIPEAATCASDPTYRITNLCSYRGPLLQDAQSRIGAILNNPSRLQKYQNAGTRYGVPWQVLIAIHYNEASADPNRSMLNGRELCNRASGSCPDICSNESLGDLSTRDILCGAKILSHNGSVRFGISNIDTLKNAINSYIGYGRSDCPESTMIGHAFNDAHQTTIEQPHDCVPASCNPGCVSDYTSDFYRQHGSLPQGTRGCCTIKVWEPGSQGYLNLHRITCADNNVINGGRGHGQCELPVEGSVHTFAYNPGEYSPRYPTSDPRRNVCGAWRLRSRPGHLAMIGFILQRTGGCP